MTSSSRRAFLHGLGLSAGAAAFSTLGLPRSALADPPDPPDAAVGPLGTPLVVPRVVEVPPAIDVPPSVRKFLFVFNAGGWDPLTVFAPMFNLDGIDMEAHADPLKVGGLTLVDSPARPLVRTFFETYHQRIAVLNGVSVRSLSHDVCKSICLTGTSTGRAPEWSRLLNSGPDGDPQNPRQVAEAVRILSEGEARCATIRPPINWDTHKDNARQSGFFESLFVYLGGVMTTLSDTEGQFASLADETVVVLLSEMGRTPQLNDLQGRDHWPYTSVMMLGPGITGSTTIGGFDERYHGFRIDPQTGERDLDGDLLTTGALGATLVKLAGGDHSTLVPGQTPIEALLV